MPSGTKNSVAPADAKARLATNSLRFTENAGQWDARGRFLFRTANLNYWVTDNGLVLDYVGSGVKGSAPAAGQAIKVDFAGGKSGSVEGFGLKPFNTDYITGKSKVANVRSYAEVWTRGIYPGVDLRSYIDKSSPRYDFVVAPGGNPGSIAMKFTGANSVEVNKKGELILHTEIGAKRQVGLMAFQTINGTKKSVSVKFEKLSKDKVGFNLGSYDKSAKLTIDPLIYGSYYGGDDGPDEVHATVSDIDGGVYMTGKTRAPKFPAIFGPYGFNLVGEYDAFITKLQGDAYLHDYAAYVGGALNDSGDRLALDPFGNVWIAGSTDSSNFPGNTRDNVQFLFMSTGAPNIATGGTFRMVYGGVQSADIAWNATPIEVQLALEAISTIGAGKVKVTSTDNKTLPQGGRYRVALANDRPLRLSVISTKLAARALVEKRPANQAQELKLTSQNLPTGGTYRLTYAGSETPDLAWNASAASVRAALEALPGIGVGNITVKSSTRPAPNEFVPPYVFYFKNALRNTAQRVTVTNANLTNGGYDVIGTDRWSIFNDPLSGQATGGTIDLFYGNPTAGYNGVRMPFAGDSNFLSLALSLIPNFASTTAAGTFNVMVDGEDNLGNEKQTARLPGETLVMTLVGLENPSTLAPTNEFIVDSANLRPRPIYATSKANDAFVIRFKKEGTKLNPLPTRTLMFGGDFNETLSGFAITPKDNPNSADPVQIAFAGSTTGPIGDIPGPQTSSSYYTRYTYTETAKFQRVDSSSKYFSDALTVEVGGATLDSEGSLYLAGTVFNQGNIDTSVDPKFVTTNRAFENGRLLRNNDMFVRKYDLAGNLVYSVLVGGNNNERIGGLDIDPTNTAGAYGSAVAVDTLGNAYITGITTSFNYPRTRGVFGETFTNNPNAVVTKLNSDASEIVYSTNLKTTGGVVPAGIAVDLAGNAYITGNIHPVANFPDTNGALAGDPNQPTSTSSGTVSTTGDAIDPTYDMPASPEMPTQEGFLNVLNATATQLIYGTYLGGILDDVVYGPYVDRFGDVWVNGWTDSARSYALFSSTGIPTVYSTSGPLPGSLITPLAFKAQGDAAGGFGIANMFGLLDPLYFVTGPVLNWSPLQPGAQAKPMFNVNLRRDGFVVRQRVAFPGVSTLVVNPGSAPGGLGTQLVSTLTLTSPAPVGGAEINYDLSNSGGSFDPSGVQTKLTRIIAAGQTTDTVTIFTRPVSLNTPVQLKAGYLGSFKIAQFVVIPWLSQMSLTPTEVVGGNESTGTITLAAPAPVGGVVVDLLTDTPSLVSFPGGSQATIPAGQTTGTFKIDTNGVVTTKFPTVTVSLLGVGKTQTLTLQPITLSSLVFAPSRIAGGSSTTGTVTFTGKSGIDFNLKVTLDKGTPNYRFRASDGSPQVAELILPIKAGDVKATFILDSVFETINTKRVATAVRLTSSGAATGEKVNGTLFIDAVNLTSFVIDPTTVAGGDDAIGTVTIGSPAPDGGVNIAIKSSKPSVASAPAVVTVPAGQTKGTFTISTATLVGLNETVVINAKRGSVSIDQTLQVTGSSFTFAIAPTSVVGGSQNSVGTVTLQKPAPAGGATVKLINPSPAVLTIPSTVTIPAGETEVSFTITTKAVSEDATVTLTARIGTTDATATITVKAISLINFTITPNVLRPFKNAKGVVTLEAPAPKGGTKVKLTLETSVFAVYPTTLELLVPEGQTSVEFTLQSKRFSIPFNTTVTATAGSGSKSVVVTIMR